MKRQWLASQTAMKVAGKTMQYALGSNEPFMNQEDVYLET